MQRQPQPPGAREHPLAAAQSRARVGLRTVGNANVAADGEEGTPRPRARALLSGADGALLVLRGSMTPATRQQYAAARSGNVLSQEDAWQRAVEFLFERLAVRGHRRARDRPGRRSCSPASALPPRDERRWVRDVLREHLAEHFPEMNPP